MVKNVIMLFLSLILVVFLVSSRVSALKDNNYDCYYDIERYFLNNLGIDKFRVNFVEKFDVLDSYTEKNKILMRENKELNNKIKMRLEEIKSIIGNDIWREIRGYKNEINDKKISTRDKVKDLIDAQKHILEVANYSDESIANFINVLINAQRLKRESIEFEKNYLHKINDLIL